MALDESKYSYGLDHALRDTRPMGVKIWDWLKQSDNASVVLIMAAGLSLFMTEYQVFVDLVFVFCVFFVYILSRVVRKLPSKLPAYSHLKSDPNNTGGSRSGKPEGIMYLGNRKESDEEIWYTNSDIRTHILYLGTTGSGKTEGLKSIASNALGWGSGFIYIDGKADTDLWSSLSSLCRRFGRDDDLMVINYMTGNSDEKAPSNSMNPFSSGSSSYLTNMLVSLMPAAEGDNAMWKERAVSLLNTIMPAMTWMRDNLDVPLSISSIRKAITFEEVVKLSRNEALPEQKREAVKDYLNELPGYDDNAFDDEGRDKPMGPNTPQIDTQVPKQQHGYLTMQFTRSLQSLGDDYGYIFDVDYADIDMVDIVLNRRILVVLIPALEKSQDETANLGKIVAATLKGMMGSTLGATVEGDTSTVIENKPTHAATPFVTIFDEVGYYTTEGMAVMAAQARSLGFCLVYAAQDLPALQKRVKEEANSITANCNIKIFGKLEDPTQTKDFFEKTIGKAIVTQISGYQINPGSLSGSFEGQQQASITFYDRASYDGLQELKEGQAVLSFSNTVHDIQIYYCNPGHAKAMRVQRMLGLEKADDYVMKNLKNIAALRDRLVHKKWTAGTATAPVKSDPDLDTVLTGLQKAGEADLSSVEQGAMAIATLYASQNPEALTKAPETPKEEETPQTSEDKKPEAPAEDDSDNPMQFFGGESDADSTDKTDEKPHEDQAINQDEEETEQGSGGNSGGVKPLADYTAEEAIDTKAHQGMTVLPDELSDEVKNILKSAADTLTSGLFTPPTMDQYHQGESGGDSRGFKAKNIQPGTQPGKTGR